MKKLLTVLGLLVLLSKLSYSQETYPKLAIINGDTVVLITVEQSIKINEKYEETRSLKEKVFILDSSYNEQLKLNTEKDSLIEKNQGNINIIIDEFTHVDKENQKLRKQRKWLIPISAALGLIIGILIN